MTFLFVDPAKIKIPLGEQQGDLIDYLIALGPLYILIICFILYMTFIVKDDSYYEDI